jgi:hypothetical protein
MAKNAKPKPANQKGVQHKHNSLTRWMNDVRRKPDLLWDWSILYDAVEEYLPDGTTRTKLVKKKFDELKTRLHPPLDELLIDWETEIQHYAIENNARIEREPIPSGGTRYTVYNEYAAGAKKIRLNLIVVETPRAVSFGPKKNRGRKNNKEDAASTPV